MTGPGPDDRQQILRCPGVKLVRSRHYAPGESCGRAFLDLLECGPPRVYLVLETLHTGKALVSGLYLTRKDGMWHLQHDGENPPLPAELERVLEQVHAW